MFSPLKLISMGVCVMLVVGYWNRRRKRVHIPLMASAFLIDLAVVLYIEITRDAIASAQAKMGPLMIIHICLSVTTLGLYVAQVVGGIKLARGKPCGWHRRTGLTLLVTRFGNLITSFLVM